MFNVANDATSTLASAVADATVTTWYISSTVNIPTANFVGKAGSVGTWENVLCSTRSGTVLTVTRGYEGSTAQAHVAGVSFFVPFSATVVGELQAWTAAHEGSAAAHGSYYSSTAGGLLAGTVAVHATAWYPVGSGTSLAGSYALHSTATSGTAAHGIGSAASAGTGDFYGMATGTALAGSVGTHATATTGIHGLGTASFISNTDLANHSGTATAHGSFYSSTAGGLLAGTVGTVSTAYIAKAFGSTAGQLITFSGAGTPALIAPATTNGYILTWSTATGQGEWATATGGGELGEHATATDIHDISRIARYVIASTAASQLQKDQADYVMVGTAAVDSSVVSAMCGSAGSAIVMFTQGPFTFDDSLNLHLAECWGAGMHRTKWIVTGSVTCEWETTGPGDPGYNVTIFGNPNNLRIDVGSSTFAGTLIAFNANPTSVSNAIIYRGKGFRDVWLQNDCYLGMGMDLSASASTARSLGISYNHFGPMHIYQFETGLNLYAADSTTDGSREGYINSNYFHDFLISDCIHPLKCEGAILDVSSTVAGAIGGNKFPNLQIDPAGDTAEFYTDYYVHLKDHCMGNEFPGFFGWDFNAVKYEKIVYIQDSVTGTPSLQPDLGATENHFQGFMGWLNAGNATAYILDEGLNNSFNGGNLSAYSTAWNGRAGIAPSQDAIYDAMSSFSTVIQGTAISTQVFGDTAVPGTAGKYAAETHKHAMPGEPSTANLSIANSAYWAKWIERGVAGTVGLTFSNWVCADTAGLWWLTDADAKASAIGPLGVVVDSTIAASATGNILRSGLVRADAQYGTAAVATAILYLSTDPGSVTITAPTGTGDVIRIAGFKRAAGIVEVNPRSGWSVHS